MKRSLTQRQLQIASLMAEGHNAQTISEKLSLSVETIRSHKKNMLAKTNCKNSVMLVAQCIKQGLI